MDIKKDLSGDFLDLLTKYCIFRHVSSLKLVHNYVSSVQYYVGNFVQILVFRPTVDRNVRRGSDGQGGLKNPGGARDSYLPPYGTNPPEGCARSGGGSPSAERFLRFFNKNNAISGLFEL